MLSLNRADRSNENSHLDCDCTLYIMHNIIPSIQTCTCGPIAAVRRYIVIIAYSVHVHCTWDYLITAPC